MTARKANWKWKQFLCCTFFSIKWHVTAKQTFLHSVILIYKFLHFMTTYTLKMCSVDGNSERNSRHFVVCTYFTFSIKFGPYCHKWFIHKQFTNNCFLKCDKLDTRKSIKEFHPNTCWSCWYPRSTYISLILFLFFFQFYFARSKYLFCTDQLF